MNTKKKSAKKRANIMPIKETTIPDLVPAKVTNKDTEVESLALICSIVANWSQEQRNRNLEYICGKYYDFS